MTAKIIEFPISDRLLQEFLADYEVIMGQTFEETEEEINEIINSVSVYDLGN